MKIKYIKELQSLNEQKLYEKDFVFTKKTVDQLAEKLFDEKLPEKFKLSFHIEGLNKKLGLEYELGEKEINGETTHHLVHFKYELSHETQSEIHQIKKGHWNKMDVDENLEDLDDADFPPESLDVFIELDRNMKVYGHMVY